MKNKFKMLVSIVAFAALVFCLGIPSVSAEDSCVVTSKSTSISGNTVCILDEEVDAIYVNATLAELHTILHAYKNNPALNYTTNASGATIYATVTDIFSTTNITDISGDAPAGATVRIVPGVVDVVYNLPFTMPTGFSIDFTGKTLNIPDTTSIAEAVALFQSSGANIVAAGAKYNISAEGSNNTTTVHLNEGQNLVNIFEIINNQALSGVIVAVPDYHVNLLGQTPVIWLEGDLTEEEVLDLVKTLNVNATVRLINSNAFTVTLESNKDPVINRLQLPETPKNPETSDINLAIIIITTAVALIGTALLVKNYRKNNA